MKTLLITYDLQPPWDSGLKVYGRGLLQSLQNIRDIDVTAMTMFDDVISDHNGNGKNYDYVHVVQTGFKPVTSALKRFKKATVFKHIVTPSIGLRSAINTKVFYSLINGWENRRMVRCFSSRFVADSYFMHGSGRIVPPSVDTDAFTNTKFDLKKRNDVLDSLRTSEIKVGLENLQSNPEKLTLLYSGPLTEDRFPHRTVLNALKGTSSKILIIGRSINNGADSGRVSEILSYARKIDIENRVSIVSKTLAEHEKVSLINYSDIVIQPFARNTQLYVAVDPPIFLLEAMACGKPVITSKSYSFRSLIKNGYNGYTIDWDSYGELDKALLDCQSTANKISELGMHARQTVLEDFSCASVAKKLQSIYNDYN